MLSAPRSQRHHIGLDPTASAKQIMDKVIAAKSAAPIPPKVVKSGPCKGFRLTLDQFNLETLPCPPAALVRWRPDSWP
ncbi:hypothetical protein F4813DRAFT_389861 [Daldinia decipiens]|uniref:uncharacterized protein n=1 Tax=Daldinia decipiens TaxID=326647 RepID=UPI0020C5A258|nr:uncharacterized protein F4813DRAFT_389861 [Daldinia decipiens]KAI1657274.1 hypothetical protein F4813DRAFT_389861 [Daldinia decipiens]